MGDRDSSSPLPVARRYADIFDARGHLYNEAMGVSPHARQRERAELIALLGELEGRTIADAPAGGGYVADGIARAAKSATVICIEPSRHFGAQINTRFRRVHEPLASVSSLDDGCLHGIASLAGLHHITDRLPVYREWARLLGRGGTVAVADVQKGTGVARFLNEFVHRHVRGGHEGVFIRQDEWECDLVTAGLSDVNAELSVVPWRFETLDEMLAFCRTLFALESASHDEIEAATRDLIGVREETDGVFLDWQLRYASATK